jgi:hypothetical protein
MTQEALKLAYDYIIYGTGDSQQVLIALLDAMDEESAQPEQASVVCRFCCDEKGCWAWQCDNCGRIDDSQEVPPPQRKPLTDDEMNDIMEKESWGFGAIALNHQLIRTIRRTEAAHGIKENT